jgi:hypothetical protein
MSTRTAHASRRAVHAWLAALVLMYCPALGYVYTTTAPSAAADTQRDIDAILQRPPAPPPPLPVLKTFVQPDLVMQRDPLQPAVRKSAEDGTSADTLDTVHFVAAFTDENHACAVSCNDTGQLARWCVGDELGSGTVAHIDAARVTLDVGTRRRVIEVAPLAGDR